MGLCAFAALGSGAIAHSTCYLAALISADKATVTGLGVPAEFLVGLYLTDSGPLPTTGEGYEKAAVATVADATPPPTAARATSPSPSPPTAGSPRWRTSR